jgi:branched-chain amino acid transport system ATP-binding protein
MSAVPLLQIEDLGSSYGRVRALSGVSLEIRRGELVALVGSNGAGKTTLLRCLSGVQPIDGGKIRFDGRDIDRLRASERVALGIAQVPEGRLVFPQLTVEDNLQLGGYGRDRTFLSAGIARAYAMFPILGERRRQLAGSLSGGQQQMLALGRALMSAPKLLLLDEPSMGLAPVVVEQIFDIIEELRASGTTILLVEQNANAALALADRGYVIETGRIVLAGDGSDLLEDRRVQEAYLGV